MEPLQSGSSIGSYRLVRLLGEGGMGEVWEAKDELADRRVALKFIQPLLLRDPGTKTRFTNEARTLGRLDHDRVVPLYAVIEEGGRLAFALRYIDGGSLADRIESQFPFPQSFLLSSARDILGALGDAHSHGIIHRDIKPHNILVDRQNRSFLTDFGIAISDTQERATKGEFAIGTPHYMSPEQIRRPRDIAIASGGHRTDIYSYGIVLFEMLTGQVPFGQNSGAEETFAIQEAQCNEPPPQPRRLNPAITPSMEAVVLRCLEKNPDLRPQSCAELLAEIEAAAAGALSSAPSRRTVILDPTTVHSPMPPAKPVRGSATVLEASPRAARPTGHLRFVGIGAAIILLAVGGGGLWWKMRTDSPQQGSQLNQAPVQTTTAPPAQKKPEAKPQRSGTTANPQQPPPQVLPNNPPSAPVDPNAEAKQRAMAMASQAEEEFQNGHDCDAEDKLFKANQIYPIPGYNDTFKTYKLGCDHP